MYDSWLIFTFHDWFLKNVTQGIGQFKLRKGTIIWKNFRCKGLLSFPCSGMLIWCPCMCLIISLVENICICILCVSIALFITWILCFAIVLCVCNYYWHRLSLNFLSNIIFALCVLVLHLFCSIILGLCVLFFFLIFRGFFFLVCNVFFSIPFIFYNIFHHW